MRNLVAYIFVSLINTLLFTSCLEEYEPHSQYVDSTNTILYDKYYTRIGQIDTLGRIWNSSYTVVGHIDNDGKVKDKYYTRIGEIKKVSETYYNVKDANYDRVGHININNGRVTDENYNLIGYGKGNEIWKSGVILLLFDLE